MVRRSSFRAQAAAAFAAVIAVCLAIVLAAFVIHVDGTRRREALLTRYAQHALIGSRVQFHAERLVADSRGYLLTGDPTLLESIRESKLGLTDTLGALRGPHESRDDSRALQRIRAAADEYLRTIDDLARSNASPQAGVVPDSYEDRLLPKRGELKRVIDEFVSAEERLFLREREIAEADYSRELRLVFSVGSAGTLVALALAWLFGRRLVSLYEREQEATQRAERAVEAKQELLGIVAHDLRTPLSAILMKATLLRRTSADPAAKASGQTIESVAARMEHLIQSLLDAASIEAGSFSIAPAPCSTEEVLEPALEMMDAVAHRKSVRIERVGPGLDSHIVGDRERLIQVLTNLLGNAVKFTPEGGRIELRVESIARSARFEVRDTGPGIPATQLDRVFERHWRARPGGRGAGLGLYIARAILAAHGGRIWAEGNAGGGAVFRFEVPLASKACSTPPAGRGRPTPSPPQAVQ